MTRWYWKQVGGTLIEEFHAVRQSPTNARRLIDGLIIHGGETKIAKSADVDLSGKDVTVIQAKANRLGMYLMGQAFFSAALIREFDPKTIKSVALCKQDDSVMRELFERHDGMEVVVCPPEVFASSTTT
jgi:hypothetical protein